MDNSNRPRPQNLTLSSSSTPLSDLRCSTAALKPFIGSEWPLSLRSSISATLKQGSAFDAEPKSASTLAQQFKEEIEKIVMKKKIRTPRPTSQVLEVASDADSEENRAPLSQNSTSGTKNSVDSIQRELSAKSKSDFEETEGKKELLQEDIAILTKELEESSMAIAKKEEEISELLIKIKTMTHEKEEMKKNMESEIQAKIVELGNVDAQKIVNLEAEVRTLVQEQENSAKALQQIHEAKVLINEVISSPQAEFLPALQCLIQEFIKTQDGLKEEFERIKDQQKTIDQFEAEKVTLQEKNQKQEQETALLLYKLEESTKTYTKAVNEFEQQIVTKDQYIQALIFDVEQMKEFIVEHHGESIFEKDEKEPVVQVPTVEETPQKEEVIEEVVAKEEESPEKIQEEEQVQEEVTPVPEETTPAATQSKKVVVVVAKPVHSNKYDSYNNSNYNNGYYDRGYYNRGGYYEKKKYDRPYKSHYKDDHYYESKRNSYNNTKQAEVAEPVKEPVVKEEKVEAHWDKRTREEDPSFQRLEKMVIELNEKLIASEKRAKKTLEEKLEEAAKAAEEKEQEFVRQIEMVQEEKKALLKKIDDMQWDRAYEYTEKAKTEKKEEVKVVDNKAAKKKSKK